MQSSRHGRSRSFLSWLGLPALLALLAFACNTADLEGPKPPPYVDGSSVTPDGPDDEDPRPDADAAGDEDAGIDDVTPVVATSKVTIQVQPSDDGAAVLSAIQGAKKSVHMTMYLLTNYAVQDALIALHKAGKDVKVVLNKTFPQDGGNNNQAFNKLSKSGVPVVWAPGAYAFTHAKSIIVDSEKVLLMTMNLTAKADNREFIAVDEDADDVADAEKVFDADFNGKTVLLSGKLVISPKDAQPIDPRTRLVSLIARARTSLDVEIQSISDTGIVDAIVDAKKRGVAVRVVTTALGDTDESPAQADAIAKMKQNDVAIVGLSDPYVHSKAIVVDGKYGFVGSQNFTSNALFNNREFGVVTDAAAEVTKIVNVIAADFAKGTPR